MKNFNIEKLQNIVVRYKLPISFDVCDSIGSDTKGEPYLINIDNIPAQIRFKRIYENRWGNGFDYPSYSKIEEDRSGILSHSYIEVWFDNQMIDSDKINKKLISIIPDQFVAISIDYLNKFINIYRRISNQFWLRNIIRNYIFNFEYYLIDSNDNKKHITKLISNGPIYFNGGEEFKLEKKDEELLRVLILHPYYSFKDEMISIILDNFSLGRYNLALTQGATLFENFIYSELKNTLSKTKLDKIKKKEECGCFVGISEICTRGLKEFYNFDFENTKEWEDIKEFVLKPRNKIVHGEILENIEGELCLKGLTAIKTAENLLSDKVFGKSIL